ncbi:hypothetical protein GCM10009577_21650 [Streptomyces javensis]
MFFVDTLKFEGLDHRSYLAGGPRTAVVGDPPRDIDQVIAAAARRGVRIAYVAETHVHNDYLTGGPELARVTGARYLVPAAADVSCARVPVADGDTVEVEEWRRPPAADSLLARAALPDTVRGRPGVAIRRPSSAWRWAPGSRSSHGSRARTVIAPPHCRASIRDRAGSPPGAERTPSTVPERTRP